MNDISNVRFIDAHAEGYRGHDDIHIFNTIRHQVWTSIDIGTGKARRPQRPSILYKRQKGAKEYAVFAGAGSGKAAGLQLD
jgi:hypothetical protein